MTTAPLNNSPNPTVSATTNASMRYFMMSFLLGLINLLPAALLFTLVYHSLVQAQPVLAVLTVLVVSLIYGVIYYVRITTNHLSPVKTAFALGFVTLIADVGIAMMANVEEAHLVSTQNTTSQNAAEVNRKKTKLQSSIEIYNQRLNEFKTTLDDDIKACRPREAQTLDMTARQLDRHRRTLADFDASAAQVTQAVKNTSAIAPKTDAQQYAAGVFEPQPITVSDTNPCLNTHANRVNDVLSGLLSNAKTDFMAIDKITQVTPNTTMLQRLRSQFGGVFKASWPISLTALCLTIFISGLLKGVVKRQRTKILEADPIHSGILDILEGRSSHCALYADSCVVKYVFLYMKPTDYPELYSLILRDGFGKGTVFEVANRKQVAMLFQKFNPPVDPSKRWFAVKLSVLKDFYHTSAGRPSA